MADFFGDIGNTIGGFFGDKSHQYGAAADSYSNIANQYNPYIERGTQAANFLMPQYQQLAENPNFLQDKISGGFTMSPYQSQLIRDVTNQMNINAANTGMIRSPVAQQALNDRVNSMTGQFLNDYISRGMGSYGMGIGGMENFNKMGYEGMNQKANYLSGGIDYNLAGDLSRQNAANNMITAAINAASGGFGGFPGMSLPNGSANQTKTPGGFNMDF